MEPPVTDEEHSYDLSWQMRRVALAVVFGTVPPRLQKQRVEALSKGQRIWFAPDDEGLYIEQKLDRVFRDRGQGKRVGG